MISSDNQPQHRTSSKLSAADFADFFRSKVQKIRTSTAGAPQPLIADRPAPPLSTFESCHWRRNSDPDKNCASKIMSTWPDPHMAAEAFVGRHCTSNLSSLQSFHRNGLSHLPLSMPAFSHCSRNHRWTQTLAVQIDQSWICHTFKSLSSVLLSSVQSPCVWPFSVPSPIVSLSCPSLYWNRHTRCP